MTTPARARHSLLRLAAATLMLLSLSGRAAEPQAPPPGELAQLREQLAQLRQTLERLDARLQQLERAGVPAGVPAAAPVASAAAAAPVPPASPPPAPPAPAAPPAAPAAPTGVPAPAPAPPMAGAAGAPAAGLGAHEQAVLAEQVRTADALAAWRDVRTGMSQDAVRRLLGEPQSTLAVGNRTGWIYTYRNAGKGSVFFSPDGVVVSLISPGQGTLHLY